MTERDLVTRKEIYMALLRRDNALDETQQDYAEGPTTFAERSARVQTILATFAAAISQYSADVENSKGDAS